MNIRVATADDAAAIAEIYAPIVRDTVISFEIEPPTAEDFVERIAIVMPKFPWLVAEIEGKVAGYAYAGPHRDRAAYRWSSDVTVYVHADFRKMGVGRALYQRLFNHLREMGYQTLFAGITLPNEGSVGLHEAMGFRPIGIYKQVGYKFGEWHDTGWWGLPLGEYPVPLGEPQPFILGLDAV